MAKNLVIVESPAKAKTIGKYLGKNYRGQGLARPRQGSAQEGPVGRRRQRLHSGLRSDRRQEEADRASCKPAAKGADTIYLAADPDREGEAICFHLQEELQGAARTATGPKIFRVMFNEITKNAIQKAFEKPAAVNLHLVDAQQARRILDRLVGYKISPLLWDKVRRGLSAGRVQTVALRLIVDREREIRAFQKREYWTIDVNLAAKKPPQLSAHLAKKNDENVEIPNRSRRRRPSSPRSTAPTTLSSRSPIRRSAAIRCLRSSPPRCSRKPRASCASA